MCRCNSAFLSLLVCRPTFSSSSVLNRAMITQSCHRDFLQSCRNRSASAKKAQAREQVHADIQPAACICSALLLAHDLLIMNAGSGLHGVSAAIFAEMALEAATKAAVPLPNGPLHVLDPPVCNAGTRHRHIRRVWHGCWGALRCRGGGRCGGH